MEEQFITLTAYPDYEISTTVPHVFRRKGSDKLLNQSLNNVGYYLVHIDGSKHLVHRLIALQFLDNPDDLSDVNHKNKHRTDNRIENLEWVSHPTNLKQRKPFKKQQSEFVTELDNYSIINVGDYNGHDLSRYYFDSSSKTIYLRQSRGNKYKIIKPTKNGNIQIVALVDNSKKIITRSYAKLIKDLLAKLPQDEKALENGI